MEKVRTKEDVQRIFAARNRVRQLQIRMMLNRQLTVPIQRQISELRYRILKEYDVIL